MTNTYGLKMTGLRRACGATKGLYPYGPFVEEIIYDMDSGRIRTNELLSSSYTRPELPEICAWTATQPLTMQEIADRIYDAVREYNAIHNIN